MRDFRLDNTKGLLIFLVVLGHIIERYAGLNDTMRFLRFEIYLFHMPLFIFVSGYFSKKFIDNDKFELKKILPLLYIYILMETYYVIYNLFIIKKENFTFTFFSESMIPWFMLALVIWKTVTFLLKKIKTKTLFIGSVMLACLIGLDYQVGDFLVIARVIVFYPFFLLGYIIKKEQLEKVIKSKKVFAFTTLFTATVTILIATKIEFFMRYNFMLSGRNSFKYLENQYEAILARFVLMIVIVIVGIFIMQIVGNKKNILTWLGQRTLSIYVFHEVVLMFMTLYGADKKAEVLLGENWIYCYMLLAIPITFILATKPFDNVMNVIMKNAGRWILKNEEKEAKS